MPIKNKDQRGKKQTALLSAGLSARVPESGVIQALGLF